MRNYKIFFMPSQNFIDESGSEWQYGVTLKENKKPKFEIDKIAVGSEGNVLELNRKIGKSDEEDFCVDASLATSHSLPMVLTEMGNKNQSFSTLKIKTIRGLKPGAYSINFILTYFNGAEWKTSNSSVVIRILNVYERNPWLIPVFGVVIAAILSALPISYFLKLI